MLLQIRNLKVHFKHDHETVKAVNGIDFTIDENEIVGLVGESGSGKTITALSIMGLLSKKDCKVDGEISLYTKAAIIFQEPFTSLNPVLRVGEQIDEAMLVNRLHLHGDSKKKQTVQKQTVQKATFELLRKVKIHDAQRIYNSYPHLLSGGERQRAMIAMALALEPKLLIADEPTTALDVTIQKEILDLILELKKDMKMAVLFITHDFGIINEVADRVLVMKDGKIIERGEKRDLLSSPKEKYTKALLDAVPRIHAGGKKIEDEKRNIIMTIKNINKSFLVEKGIFKRADSKVKAVSSINLKIKEGETLGLVGESGSGKTTLGKLLIGLLNADSGEITSEERKRSMQIVFQDPYSSLDPRMRMEDIILEGPTIRGMKKDEKDAILREVLSEVHLSYKDRLKYPHQFSGGQRQRIAIARALAVKPRILILDEPVSSLDVIIQSGILKLLKDLQKELSLTYVFISHDLRVVEYMADEIAVMHKGEIVEFASREEIYKSPKHPYTKKLLSSIPTL